MKSHHILRNLLKKESIRNVQQKCLNYLDDNPNIYNYSSEISCYSEEINLLINNQVYDIVKNFLNIDKPVLEAVELHIQRANCDPIPPHQDNFYHCIDPDKGLKVLIPLQNLSPTNGGLIYLDIDKTYPVVNHSPSNILNFSAYIDNQIFSKLEKKHTSYELKVGDIVFHFINSIHYSLGNKTKKDSLFLVYRYQWPKALIDKKAEEKYNKCYSLHVKKLNKIIK